MPKPIQAYALVTSDWSGVLTPIALTHLWSRLKAMHQKPVPSLGAAASICYCAAVERF
jgi:hypothetical protein